MNTVLALSQIVIKELYRRKDFYVLFVLTGLITAVAGSANFFNDDKIARYLKELCLLLIWLSALFIAVGASARQIPAERENRTIFPLLAKPVTRGQVVAGKFFGCWLACGLALLMFYLFLGVVTGSREREWPVLSFLQALWLQWVFLAVVIAMVLWGSVVFAAPSSNATICVIAVIGIWGLGHYLNRVAVQEPEPLRSFLYVLYFVIPHLEWFDIRDMVTHERGLVPWWDCFLATLYGAAYSILFLFATWVFFRRKPLSQ
jgi:ABC-type transport system involved in multi-copper enzyme maturation permease subunit